MSGVVVKAGRKNGRNFYDWSFCSKKRWRRREVGQNLSCFYSENLVCYCFLPPIIIGIGFHAAVGGRAWVGSFLVGKVISVVVVLFWVGNKVL